MKSALRRVWVWGVILAFAGAAVAAITHWGAAALGLNDPILLGSGILNIGFALVAVWMLFEIMPALTRSQGVDFRKDVLEQVKGGNLAVAHYRGLLFVGVCILLASLLGGCATPAQARVFPDRYDGVIQESWQRWNPGYPWKVYKAQLYQESRLDPDAVSPVGARGLAQFMPATWSEISHAMRLGAVSPHMANPAIAAGAYYMRRLLRGWSSPRPAWDRLRLGQASYNAGFGSLLRAQDRCGGPVRYNPIVACLPAVTGPASRETITYVERIDRWYRMML